jgi:cell division inhibitor SepF
MRSSRKSNQGPNMEVCVIKPSSMEDTREIADTLVDNSTVILNLEGIDVELAQRIIDFTSGACYSLGGSLQKVSSYIFVLGPYNVDITGDLQNILGGSAPSVRAGY